MAVKTEWEWEFLDWEAFKEAVPKMANKELFDLWELLNDRRLAVEEVLAGRAKEERKSLASDAVVATYYKPRREYDYEGSAKDAGVPEEVINRHIVTTNKIDWKAVCRDAEIKPRFSLKPERVIVKYRR